MAKPYRHTQRGTLMLITLSLAVLAAALLGVLALQSGRGSWVPFVICALLLVTAWLYASLTVEVSGGETRWYFGPGLWDYRIALFDIEDARIVRNTWPGRCPLSHSRWW